jgi:hypothetical protein
LKEVFDLGFIGKRTRIYNQDQGTRNDYRSTYKTVGATFQTERTSSATGKFSY